MRWLFVARDRKTAEVHALEWFPRATGPKRDQRVQGDNTIDIAIFGQDLQGRSYDRICVAQQKHLPPAYSTHLQFRLRVGGRFEKLDPVEAA